MYRFRFTVRLIVQLHRRMPVDKHDIQRLPLAGRLLGSRGRRNPAVDRAHVVAVEWPAIFRTRHYLSGGQTLDARRARHLAVWHGLLVSRAGSADR